MIIENTKNNNDIFIKLQIEIRHEWNWVRAINWNHHGFDFYDNHDIEHSQVLCKKGPQKFEGHIRKVCNDNEAELSEINLNAQLYEELNKMDRRDSIYDRIMNLIHEMGRIEEKKIILSALLLRNAENQESLSSAVNKSNAELYHYRVVTESDKWAEIVQVALEASSVMQAIDNFGKGLFSMANMKKDTANQ